MTHHLASYFGLCIVTEHAAGNDLFVVIIVMTPGHMQIGGTKGKDLLTPNSLCAIV